MGKYAMLLKNEYVFSVATRMVSVLASLLQSVIIARFLGPELQGTNSYIFSICSIGSIILTFGMHQAYPYLRKMRGKEAIYHDYLSTIAIVFLVYFLICSVVSILIIPTIELKIALVLCPIYGYSRIVAYVALVEHPNVRNLWWTIIGILDLIYAFLLYLFASKSILAGASILTVAEIAKCIIFTYLLRPKVRITKHLFSMFKELIKLGFFPMLGLLMSVLNYKIDILMLRSFEFITYSQIGVYSIGMNFADKIVIIPDTLQGVLVSKMAKGAGVHEVAKVCRICFWASSAICVGFLILGKKVISFLYGPAYDGAYEILMICAVGSLFVGYFKLIEQYNIVNKKQIRNVLLLLVSISVNVFLNLLLIPRYQLTGAAFASCIGYFMSGTLFIIWFTRKHKIPISEMFLIQKQDVEELIKK